MIVALTGFMASGKTTFGRAAAERIGWDFVDLDEVISTRCGSPREIFDSRGEEFFRQMESRLLEEVLQAKRDTVLALGGGTVLRHDNLQLLKRRARLIWLDTSFGIIMSELGNADRPVIRDMDTGDIRALYEERRPHYAAAADLSFPVTDTDYQKVIEKLAGTISGLKRPDVRTAGRPCLRQ